MIKIVFGFLSITALAVALCNPARAQVYKWTDEKGEVHFSDNSYDLKDAKGKASLVIPAKKAVKEPEAGQDEQEPAVQPTPDTQEAQTGNQPEPAQTASEPDVAPQPEPKKEEAAKAPASQQPPAKPVKMSKRILKMQKLEKEKSGSGQTSSPSAAR